MLECSDIHQEGEDSPDEEIEPHADIIGSGNLTKGVNPDEDQGPPEEAVGCKSSCSEEVVVLRLHDTGNDLGGTA